MKYFLNLVLLFGISLSSIQAQNEEAYFKVYQLPDTSQPNWAQLMYGDNPNVDEVIDLYDKYYNIHTFKKTIHVQNFKYWLKQVEHLTDETGHIQNPYKESFIRKIEDIRVEKNRFSRRKSGEWTTAGPFTTYSNDGSLNTRPTQTNVYAVAVAPSNHDVLYCVTEGGGVFRSSDHADNWSLISKNETFVSGRDLKVDPNYFNIVYLASGKNIYQTTTGGNTWNLIFTASDVVEQLLIHPTNGNKIYAATSNGLYYSSSGGTTWNKILNKKCWDIEMKPGNPNVVYVAVYNSAQKRAEVYKTTNGTSSWTLMDSNWYTPTDLNNASAIGCKLGVTPGDPERIYACLIGNSKIGDNGWIGVYYSLNEGNDWVNADGIDGGPYVSGKDKNTNWYYAGYSSGYHQGWYNFDMDVSHSDPDKVWIGTIWACESGNRGENIENIRSTRKLAMHADIQDIDVAGNDIWYVSDGGINYSNDEMQTVEVKNTGIHASNFWGFSQGWNVDTWTGGRYHNGDAVYHANYGLGNTVFQGGAESPTGYIDPFNNYICRYSDISDKITPNSLTQPARSLTNISLYPNQSYGTLNSSEIEYDPRYADHMYLGKANIFYKSTNGGDAFEAIFTFPENANVLEFEISRANPDIIYCLVKKPLGTIYKSINGGQHFTQMANLPTNRTRLDLSLNPTNPNNLWVISNRGSNGNKVYQTMDGGVTWENLTTADLDDHKLLDIVYQYGTDDVVYIATSLGLFYWEKSTSSWVNYSDGLPLVTNALKMIPFYRDGKLRLASGRGIWESPLAKQSLPIAQPFTKKPLSNCSRDTIQFEDYSILNHQGATWEWSFSPTPIFVDDIHKRNPKVVFGSDGFYDVSLTITDENGNTSTKSIENMIQVEHKCEKESLAGYALQLSDVGDYGRIPDLDITQTNHLTFSAWIKPNGLQSNFSGIIFNDLDKAGLNFKRNNHLGYHWPGGAWSWDSGLIVDSSQWSHVAMVATPTSITIYLNGIPSTHEVELELIDINSLKLGSYRGQNRRNYKGEMDEVCIWNRALTEEEIRQTRHLTRAGQTPYLDGLVAYYQFNDPETPLILDKIGVHHAKLNQNASTIVSTAPIGLGETQKMNISAAESYQFEATGVSIDFGNTNPEGDIYVTRLEILPDSLPSNNPHVENYWIINNYGNNSNVEVNALSFKPKTGTPKGLAENAMLYQRSENEFYNNWIEQCGATSLSANFEYTESNCQITNMSQFFIQSNTTDSILSNLIIIELDTTICGNESIFLGGEERSLAGIYLDTISIDSIIRTELHVNQAYEIQQDIKICEGDIFSSNGNNYTESGIYTDSLSTTNGCDSILFINLIVLPVYAETVDVDLCAGESITIAGETYFESGIYVDSLSTTNGCDSTLSINLVVLPVFAETVDVNLCAGESITIAGETYFESGVYVDSLTTIYGCDSILSINLTVLPVYSETVEVHLCEGESLTISGMAYFESGIYVDSLQSEVGCDSIIKYDLIINDVFYFNQTIDICEGSSVFLSGKDQFESGIYLDTFQTFNGCDSIISTNLIVGTNHIVDTEIFICEGDSIFLANGYQSENGLYIDTIYQGVCDSILRTSLTILSPSSLDLAYSYCEGDTVWVSGVAYFEEEIGIDSLQNENGCDSIVTFHISKLDAYFESDTLELCEGDSLEIGGVYYSESGVYLDSLQSVTGCDSILTTHLFFNTISEQNESLTLCKGDSILLFGNYYNESGIYIDTMVGIDGCDSLISRYDITFQIPEVSISSFDLDTICQDGSLVLLPEGSPSGGIYQGSGVQGENFNPSISELGIQEIIYTFTDEFNCTNSDTTAIYVDVCLGTSALSDLVGLKIYPNPNEGIFTIEKMISNNHSIQIEILDVTSKILWKGELESSEKKLMVDIRKHAAGVYYLILNMDGKRYASKIIRN